MPKPIGGKIHAAEARKERACFIFLSLGGLADCVQQLEGIDYAALSLLTSATDKACLTDILNSRSFVGEAENVIKEILSD